MPDFASKCRGEGCGHSTTLESLREKQPLKSPLRASPVRTACTAHSPRQWQFTSSPFPAAHPFRGGRPLSDSVSQTYTDVRCMPPPLSSLKLQSPDGRTDGRTDGRVASSGGGGGGSLDLASPPSLARFLALVSGITVAAAVYIHVNVPTTTLEVYYIDL